MPTTKQHEELVTQVCSDDEFQYKHEAVELWLRQVRKYSEMKKFPTRPTTSRSSSKSSKSHQEDHSTGSTAAQTSALRKKWKERKKEKRETETYKTPMQLKREAILEKIKMTQKVEKEEKELRALRKDKELKARRESGKSRINWYMELSNDQMSVIEMLGVHLREDMEEGHVERTRSLLTKLGVHPPLSNKHVLRAASKSYTNPVLFLIQLQKEIKQLKIKEAQRNKVPVQEYNTSEQLVLSALAHLVMPRMLTELHARMEPPPPLPMPVGPPAKKLIVRNYDSPYLTPQKILGPYKPTGKAERPPEPPELKERVMQVVTVEPPQTSQTSRRLKSTSSLFHPDEWFVRIPRREFKSVFFKAQMDKLTTPIGRAAAAEEEEQQTVDFQEEIDSKLSSDKDAFHLIGENTEPSFFSLRQSQFPEHFMRFATSIDPPDMSEAPSVIVKAEPMSIVQGEDIDVLPTTFFQGRASWMAVGEGTPEITPLIDKPDADMPTQVRLAVMGYWDALPRSEFNFELANKFQPVQPSGRVRKRVQMIFNRMAKEGNPICGLPQADLLPHINKWLMRRYCFKMTAKAKELMLQQFKKEADKAANRQWQVRFPDQILSKKKTKKLTWKDVDWFKPLAKRINNNFYNDLTSSLLNDAQLFWTSLGIQYFENKQIRDLFFAYLPSRHADVLPKTKN